MKTRINYLIAGLLFGCAAASGATTADPVSTFVAKTCLDCHDHDTKKGQFDIENLSRDLSDLQNFKRWEKVHDRVRAGEMPPKDKARPDAAESTRAMDALAARLTEADLDRRGKEGRATVRRLTRTEIDYTVQDLFALPGMSVKDDLPEDGVSAGFDKVSEALDISHVQMARYMEMGKFILDRAIAIRPQAPTPFKMRFYAHDYIFMHGLETGECVLLKDKKPDPAIPILREHVTGEQRRPYENTIKASQSAVGMFRSVDESWNPSIASFSPLIPGRYKFRMSIWSFYWDKGSVLPSRKTQVVAVSNARGDVLHFDAPSIESKVHEFEMWLEPDDKISFDLATLQNVHVYNRKGGAAEYQGPGVAFDWVDVEGPVYDQWPPESHRRIFGDLPLQQLPAPAKGNVSPAKAPMQWKPHTERRRDSRYPSKKDHIAKEDVWTVHSDKPKEDAARLLRPLLTRLFRRPVTDAQFARYTELFDQRLAAGDFFEDAMRMTITGALCSPEFLFRLEKPGHLDDWAIANRLSYLLWDSAPDDALNELASKGRLQDAATLRAQARRMLADPRSERFINDFLDQWLLLKNINATTPDKTLYPEFLPYMQRCMVSETRAFFRTLIDENLGVRNFVDSDFAMLNGQLCQVYGLNCDLAGDQITKEKLPPNSHRGGLLTQGAILKITANGTTTSPVKRGAWTIDRLLGHPPDPPPASVTAIEPDLRGTTTIRQQLDAHRNQAVCASCHRHIDPPGFAMESYDVIGHFRDRYRSKEEGQIPEVKVGEGHYPVKYFIALPVDCAGQSADGESFKDIESFKKLLLKDQRELARNFVRRLAIYATGRDITFADRPAVEAILDRCELKNPGEIASFGNYRIRAMIEELVASELFLSK